MPRTLNRLSARTVATITKPGRHADGGRLYLNVSTGGAKSWVFMWERDGRQREMGLGSVTDVPLALAREFAQTARQQLAAGLDPIEERRKQRAMPTFGEVADKLVAELAPGWRNKKHAYQWRLSLEVEAKPLRSIAVDQVTTADVLKVLQPIWTTKAETAGRVRNRIEKVLDAAKARGYRSGDNPARWRGHLENLLPKRPRLQRGHHKAMPIDDVPELMPRLRAASGSSARALEFLIYTAARSGEVIGATWGEIDLKAKLWTVPAERMKAGKVHEVPLSPQALEVLSLARTNAPMPTDLIFPSKGGKAMSNMALLSLTRRLGLDCTPHGFRSTFRDWAGDRTSFPREVVEHALAHQVGDEVERAYRRGSALAKRAELMGAWANFLAGTDNVVSFAKAAR